MKKNDLKNKMQDGFLEAAPDVYEAVLTASGKNMFVPQNEESKKTQNSGRSRIYYRSFTKYALSACAGFALFFVCLFGMLGKNQDNIYVVLDINPSVQIVMNESCQVKKLQGLNQDGRDVIQTLQWNKKDSILQTVETVVECAVEEDYLHEGGGILVTISVTDRDIYDDLEDKMGTGIDRKLKKMGISGVTTAFQSVEKNSGKEGRELLEAELVEKYGVNQEMLHQMSVLELIQYYQQYDSDKLQLSPVSEKQWQEISDKKEGEQNKKESQEKKQTDDRTGRKEHSDKTKSDAVDEDDKGKDKQSDEEKPQNDKSQPDASSQENQYHPGSEEGMQQESIPPSESEQTSVPVTQPEEAVPLPPDPPKEQENNPSQEEDGSEENGKPEEDKGKNKNNGKKDENSGKDNNNKDNSNKNNSNKDNNGKENNNKDNDNKNNGNKDNNNKENANKESNDQENGGKGGGSKNNNKDESAKDINPSCEMI